MVLDDLRWLGLQWDEGPDVGGPDAPYRQSERTARYRAVAQELLDRRIAYRCFCTEEELEAKRKQAEKENRPPHYDLTCWLNPRVSDGPYAVRFHVPEQGDVTIHDLIRGEVTWKRESLGDFILLRSDALPTYNFSVVIDDHDMEISHVIRAEEHLSNTPRQVFMVQALGYPMPEYAHLPYVAEPGSKRKLSKRKLDQYLTGVREIETRIKKAERFGPTKDPAVETPPGIPADYAEHMQLMYDLLVLAFQTDSTRVASFLLSHDGSNRSFDHIGISEGHHDLTHHMNRKDWIDKVADIDLWYVKQFARFLEKLQDAKDVDGKSLLHNSMIFYGSGNADANRHTHTNLPVILAGGGGGGLTPGRYVQAGGKPMTTFSVAQGWPVRRAKRMSGTSSEPRGSTISSRPRSTRPSAVARRRRPASSLTWVMRRRASTM